MIEDFVSFHSTIDGSFFIRHPCEELQNIGHEKSLPDVMTRVISKVNIRFLSLENPFCICRLLDTDQTFQACQSTLQL